MDRRVLQREGSEGLTVTAAPRLLTRVVESEELGEAGRARITVTGRSWRRTQDTDS